MTAETSENTTSIKDFAEQSVEKARSAVGTLLDAAQKAAESIQSSTNTGHLPEGQAVARGFGFAKDNISAIFNFAQELVRAPDLSSAVKMQSDFLRTQSEVMKKQLDELKELTPPPKP